MSAKKWQILNCDFYIAIFETIQLRAKKKKKWAQAHLDMLSRKCVYESDIYLIYKYKEDLALNSLQWLIFHKTQPNQIQYV